MIDERLAASIRRMRQVADGYLADARILETKVEATSDAAYLLQLTAFEILLKAVLRGHGAVVEPHHGYSAHIENLPAIVRARLWETAADRMGSYADFSNPGALLSTWSTNFSKLRYSYEAYDGKTTEEVRALGEAWLARGAKIEEATFRYHPEELTGVLFALKAELDTVFGDSRQ